MDSLFSCYAKHQSELDAIVREIYTSGGDSGSIGLDAFDDLTLDDLRYINYELNKKGLMVKLSLEFE